jgi:deoxyribonuclease-4
MPLLGAHMSIAGGYFKAVEAAARCKMDCVQIFSKNNNQWRAKPITEEDVSRFERAMKEHRISAPIAHASYLINLASPDRELWKKSVDAFVIELQRADTLGIPYVVLHPGAYIEGTEAAGLKRIVRAIDQIHRRTDGLSSQCLLETTAGQGSSLGCKFEHLATILDGVKQPDLLGVCVDTCHIFAAGYPLQKEDEYKATFSRFNKLVGVKKIKAFHLNDSKKPFGSRVDRHEHIGRGTLGVEPFRHLLNDRRFRKTPMYLETPKGDHKGKSWDAINLRKLRRLAPKDED